MTRSTTKSVLQTLVLAALLSTSAVQAAEETIKIKGELLFASLPQLGEFQGPLAEPLLFEATVVEDAELAQSTVIFGFPQEYSNALRYIGVEISTPSGQVLYSESAHADEFVNAPSLDLYSLFAYGSAANATGYSSGSAFWAIISGSDERFVDREINLGADLLSRGVGMGADASIASLFADTNSYPVLATGAYTYAFLYYDNTINNVTGEGYQGIAQGYVTSVSYGAEDYSLEAVIDACGEASECAMQLIQSWRKAEAVTVHEANALRQGFQASKRPN